MDEFLFVSIIFLTGTLSSIILSGVSDLATILKILSVIVLVFLIGLKVNLGQSHGAKAKDVLLKISGLFFLSLSIMLLVVATGGILSPLIIVLHITILALAFLLTFPIAMAFLFASLISIFAQYYLAFKAHTLILDPASLMIQLVSTAAVVPLSFIVARRYHLAGKIADALFAELYLSKNEEDVILESVDEGIITLDRELRIMRMNKIAQDISGFKNSEVLGKDFFEVFKLFDSGKKIIQKEQFPIKDFLRKASSFKESGIFIARFEGHLSEIDFKLSSLLGGNGKIDAFLFVFNEKKQSETFVAASSILENTLSRFKNQLININTDKRTMHAYDDLETLYKLATGEIPGLLTKLDVGEAVRKIVKESEDLSREYHVSLINSVPTTLPLPITTNAAIFEQAISKILELAIFIAAQSHEKFVTVSTGSSDENIFVSIKTATYENFPWNSASELLKPFFGTLSNNPHLSSASGLEGYLAESLLKEKNFEGGITGAKFEDGVHKPQLILTIILPYLTDTKMLDKH